MRIRTIDIVSGGLASVTILTSTLSYVAFIFSGQLSGALHYAVGFGLVSAGVMAVVFALGSNVPFAVAGPDSKPTAVLAIMATVVVAGIGMGRPSPNTGLVVLAALVLGTFAAGAAMYLLGAFRMGQWVRFIPYPVIGGFMAASGWLLTAGGLGVLAGTRMAVGEFSGSVAWQHLPQIASGIAFAAGYAFIGRIRNPLAFPLFLVAAIMLIHAFLALSGTSIDAARTAGWLLNVSGNGQRVSPTELIGALGALDVRTAGQLAGEFIALVTVTVISLLLGLVVIEAESRLDVDLDRELRLNGLANMLVGAAGGMVGTISVNRTLLNFRSGARDRASGLIAGAVCLAVLGFGTGALVYFPVPVLGGVLLHQGTSALREWLVRERRTMPLADYCQVVLIMIAIIGWDFVAGVALGVIVGCLTFAINTSRIRLIKQELDRSSYRSRVDRPMAHQEELHHSGNSIRIMWLHGFVFFGSAHRLLLDVKNMIATAGQGVCRSLILDFRQVLGFDSSAIVSFGKLRHFAEREGFTIAFSTLSPPVEKALRLGELVRPDDPVARLFPDLDAALEWCEDSLIAERISTWDGLRSADEWLMQDVGNLDLVARLVSYLELQEFAAGETIFEQGSQADALYLLYQGRVSILCTTAAGTELRLRSTIGPTVLGEMGLYRIQSRSATVRADNRCAAYRLSRGAMAHMEENDPVLALAFHKFIVRVLAARLEFANREIAGLQR